jgi:hypothetical protein
MFKPSARSSVTTGIASCVLLLPSVGCRRPSADLALPEEGGTSSDSSEPVAKVERECATPKPAPGSPDDHESPVILGARFVARDRVQLTFSEPLGPVDAVNPRQFRLSHAYATIDAGSGDRSYASGYYYDLAGADLYEPPLVVVKLELYEQQPEILALTLSRPVPSDLCDSLKDSQANIDQMATEPGAPRRGQVGLFLHYTTRGSEGIRDAVNNPLTDVGADWALNFGTRNKAVYGTEPVMRLDLLPVLACPDESMGAIGGPPGPK